MDAVQVALRRLRGWFVVWFAVQAVAGTVIAAYVLEGLRRDAFLRDTLSGASGEVTVSAGILVSMLLLALALIVFASLLELRTWARVVLLVVGWVTIASAVLNLVALPGAGSFVAPVVEAAGGDWQTLAAASVLTKVVDLVFWSWAIYTLRFNRAVREAFVRGEA